MSKLEKFVDKLKAQKVEKKKKEEAESKEKAESEPAANGRTYVPRKSREAIRERNIKFREFIESEEGKELIKELKKSQRLKTLVDKFKEKNNLTVPIVVAYSIYNSISEPKSD